MVQQLEKLKTPQAPEIIYPDSDGQPMADNTTQWSLIVTIKESLEFLFAANADVFVAGDLLWYPVEGNNKIRMAPDAMVVFGRPKGDRGSYKQWEEDNIPPQVVFEILSPGNRPGEMTKKFELYDRYGVEEYYLYDPDKVKLTGWRRREGKLQSIDQMDGWVSPRLKVRFDLTGPELQIFTESGVRFLTYSEMAQRAEREEQRAEREQQRAEREQQRAEREQQRAERERQLKEQEQQRAERERQLKEQEQQRAEQERQLKEQERQLKEQEQQRAEQERQLKEQERQLKEQAEAKIKMLYLRLQELGIDPEQL
ncbi:MAG: Uma2 family endonuclease [Hormoscilla sp. GM7CHS1pb]|nr:Uma2 family endonuclease [Hormoscilla sp. GM7CHS1pb]